MKVFSFHKSKYGPELLLDLSQFQSTSEFYFKNDPHTVDFFEILFFEKASGVFELDGQAIPLSDYLTVFASPYQRRRWRVNREDIRGYFMIFAYDFLELLFADPLFVFRLQYFFNNRTLPYLQESESIYATHLTSFRAMDAELKQLKSDSEDFLRAYLLLILAGTNRRYCSAYGLTPERTNNPIAYHFKQLVETQLRVVNTVDGFADLLQTSRVTLNKAVKAQFGITASSFIKGRILTEIKRELQFTTKTIAEIAYELNFSEPSSLVRFFQRAEGCAPSTYRQAYQNVNPFSVR